MPLYRDKRRKQIKKQISNVMVFLLAFVAFLVVFGGICLWAVVKINEERRSAESSSSASSSEEMKFEASDARNLLIVTTDDGKAQGFVAVRADPAKSRVRALAIPRDTVVDYKTSELRLYELMEKQGITVARDALAELTGLHFDNYIVITYKNIEKLIDHFEAGVVMTLTEDLNYHDNNKTIQIDEGLRTLSASQAVNVLRYPSWQGGRKQRADIQAQMTAALINQYMLSSREEQGDRDFSFMVNLASKTDILVSHYSGAKAGLAFLAGKNKGDLCEVLSFPGSYQGSGSAIRYYAQDKIKDFLKSSFE